MESSEQEIDRLRFNSHAKHMILYDYLPAWAAILGTFNQKLTYFDCFAGPGEYKWQGQIVDGSPIISVKACSALLSSDRSKRLKSINLVFIDENQEQIERLERKIDNLKDVAAGLKPIPKHADSEEMVERILQDANELGPTFFFIDPYSHPFSLRLLNQIMKQHKAEVMLNLMYYRIVMDLENPGKQDLCRKLFAPDDPRNLDLRTKGRYDEKKILSYLHSRIGSRFYVPFRVHYGPDEKVSSRRIKYFLIHYSNSFTAFNLMLRIMWKHSESGKPLMVSDNQPLLFPFIDITTLKERIVSKYVGSGHRESFNDFIERHWEWYFTDSHYRDVLKALEKEGKVRITRITSRKTGLQGDDVVQFM